ncbi:ThiF family adenylyltransferase [Lichenihabitans sp. Uapishka_5]|nr:ThiF family adenylyltransferase [Lichenihabitans sp. Uapishka_5]MDX7951461.1 ThiF family adenylyltransferase [Lichenihabitans sp. Uapishka_5]
MIWFLEDRERLVVERRAIATLAADVEWLVEAVWDLVRAQLILRLAMDTGGAVHRLEMRYPAMFPHTPPDIVPVDPDFRLSDHQWSGGSLCLEYRPDNWRPDLTGADMVRSAHRLLSADADTKAGARELPSAHDFTLGQSLRTAFRRHLATDDLLTAISGLTERAPARATLRFTIHASDVTSWITSLDAGAGPWFQPAVPKDLGYEECGVALRVPSGVLAGTDLDWTHVGLLDALGAQLPPKDGAKAPTFVLAGDGERLRLFWRFLPTADRLTESRIVPAGGLGAERLDRLTEGLGSRSVAVVGCGSAGSKIAASLTRSGVGSLLLVDDDVLMRGNLVRNDLDWHGVGDHKVEALAARLRLINPDVSVQVWRLRLGGQEASSSAAAALEAIARCDLVVDATAEADAFNLLSSVVTRYGRPLVWLEVFEGGIGGMVARHRPGLDPSPQDMRSGFLAWCRRQDAPWTGRAAGRYAGETEEGQIIVAGDAEVGVIAAHVARFALDALGDGLSFPHSMYVIGLKAGWIFEQPFDVRPVSVAPGPRVPAPALGTEQDAEAIAFIVELASKGADEDPAA